MDRYEEALERAKKGLPIDEVFPELKAIEDERIIDDAIQIIRASRLRCAEYGAEADKHLKAIAYLEKRKERDRIVPEREATDFEIEVHEIIAQARSDKRLADKDVLEQFEREAACALMWKAEKQKEQKPKITDYKISLTTNDEQSILKAVGDVYENIHNAMEQKQTEWSEDERIRNMLIEQMEHWHERALENNVVQDIKDSADAISWLEKQKKQKLEPVFKVGDKIKPKSEPKYPYREIVDIRDEVYYFDESEIVPFDMQDNWEKEQKPADLSELMVHKEPYIPPVPIPIGADEQKPAEIDEYEIIKKHITEDSLSSDVNSRLKECGWYVTDEKPAEWSEEDEKMLEHIISDLREFRDCETDEELVSDYEDEITWLKSLRPQPHWKPSKEQMEALARATNRCVGVDDAKILIKLLEQLEKL